MNVVHRSRYASGSIDQTLSSPITPDQRTSQSPWAALVVVAQGPGDELVERFGGGTAVPPA